VPRTLTTIPNTESYTKEITAGEFQCALARAAFGVAASDRTIIRFLPIGRLL
jgi:hypothetical protein